MKQNLEYDIKEYDFKKETVQVLEKESVGKDWPVVYILNNSKEAYVGETLSASRRLKQHLDNKKRELLKVINIITGDTFNKSVILDLESFLIKYMSADSKYILQNGNGGLQDHNYYQRKEYESMFSKIWNELLKRGIVNNKIEDIENSDLFKYSPYKTLNEDQFVQVKNIIESLINDLKLNKESTFIVHGGAGTGKTILAIYLFKMLNEIINIDKEELIDKVKLENEYEEISDIYDKIKDFKIGIVVPMANLRETIGNVFKNINGLNKGMVLSPSQVANSDKKFDLLIVDEAHRLRQKKNLTQAQYGSFNRINPMLGLEKNEGTELDWILKKSKYQILMYDENQTIKLTDIATKDFHNKLKDRNIYEYRLKSQLRCKDGGEEYINYIDKLFSLEAPQNKLIFDKYEFKMFDDVNDMIENIKNKDSRYGICRTVAGISWEETKEEYDIFIDGYKYKWNREKTDWINSKNSVNEIGCIHTVQGFDLNYTGVIIGNELKYDKVNHKLYVDRDEYKDLMAKKSTSDEELLEFVLNIYKVLCTRGINGTYIYACDKDLQDYLSKYINKYEEKEMLKVAEKEDY